MSQVTRYGESHAMNMPVLESPALPYRPSPGEDARRAVRHAYAEASVDWLEGSILDWLGERVGPKPGEETHAMVIDGKLFASREYIARIRQTM